MKFIAAFAMKAGKILVTARQEWTGPLTGCGEGNYTGQFYVMPWYYRHQVQILNLVGDFLENDYGPGGL